MQRVRPSQILLGLVLAAVLGFFAVLGYGLVREPGRFAAAAGVNSTGRAGLIRPGAAPDVTLNIYEGHSLRLSGLRGHPVVLNFWASWCVPCRVEAPAFENQWQAHRDQGVMFVGLDVWDSDQNARSFLKEFQIDYPNGVDPDSTASLRYGVIGVPETFFLRPDGTMALHWIGPLTDNELSADLDQLFPGLTPTPH